MYSTASADWAGSFINRLDDQLEAIYNSSVPIQDVAWKTSRERWTIVTGGESGLGKIAQAARHDDDDDINYDGQSNIKVWAGFFV